MALPALIIMLITEHITHLRPRDAMYHAPSGAMGIMYIVINRLIPNISTTIARRIYLQSLICIVILLKYPNTY